MTLFVDASALVAIIAREPEARHFADRIGWKEDRFTSPVAIWETVRAVARVRDLEWDEARALVADFLRDAKIQVMAIGSREAELSLDAHQKFGKGVHAAALNMRDCFAYACAKTAGGVILFKGDDFAETDLKDATLT
ncbi:type II toxin-antitoxin system VapC family toxin [Sphingomonas sp. SUN019]|uniref:type II toxin-antitoxin system VapC family toxin n=1 Tax=Sphingomonas sp. SUN019 TaxID=2937788 RepID=UPI0021647690|nr:type II toxin-antitoxin system VapC family toxin [Sphingomonas sp. SUN019]UVO49892.1 type II toxin-antitoxin system VapC family toxin [Sphingomonas sp. SUN019]